MEIFLFYKITQKVIWMEFRLGRPRREKLREVTKRR